MTATPKFPTKVKRLSKSDIGTGISISWNDGVHAEISSENLRRNCPCAGCRAGRGDGASHATPLTASSKETLAHSPKRPRSLTIISSQISEELNLKEIWSVGQYALGLRWGDGHATGIYTYQLLAELSAGQQQDLEQLAN